MSGKIRLDARLTAIKNMVKPCNLVADIGCDHGYLICELVKSGIAKRGLACDVNLAPLNSASRTISENCLSNSVHTVLTNGLTGLPFSEIDTFVIAGMGGDLIAEILLSYPQAKDERFDFILQPMTKHENLRKAIFENGFTIAKEAAVMCEHRVYTVIHVIYTASSRTYDDVDFCTGLLHKNDDLPSRLYLEQTVQKLEKKARGLKISNNASLADEYTCLAQKVRERIH